MMILAPPRRQKTGRPLLMTKHFAMLVNRHGHTIPACQVGPMHLAFAGRCTLDRLQVTCPKCLADLKSSVVA